MKQNHRRECRPRHSVIKRVISIFLSLMMLLSITAGLDFSAYALSSSGSCGNNVKYAFNSSTGELVISGTGAMTNYSYSSSPFCNHSDIKTVVINSGVTSIGDNAFYYCTNLTSVTIPNSVTYIGNSAFSHCTSLTSVTIPNGVTSIGSFAFNFVNNIVYNGSAIGSSWGAKAINGYVDGYLIYKDSTKKELLGCSSQATNVTIPNSVTSIGNYAFYNCTSFTSVTIPNSVTSIGGVVFYNCTSLTSVTIPDSVTSIENGTFYNCTSLTSVTIPDSVTYIGDYAFYNCTSFTSVTIPNSVTHIYDGAFYNCASLTSVTVPNSIESILDSAFHNCTSLKDVFYTGSKDKWNEISIGYDNDCLTDAVIHYGYFEHTHNYTSLDTFPSCTERGYTTYTCVECGDNYTEIVGDYLDHVFTLESSENATCINEGKEIYVCKCGKTVYYYVDALGHNYNFTGFSYGVFSYQCIDCNKTNDRVIGSMPQIENEFAEKVIRGKNNMYIDFNNDGYVNAKDYVILHDLIG